MIKTGILVVIEHLLWSLTLWASFGSPWVPRVRQLHPHQLLSSQFFFSFYSVVAPWLRADVTSLSPALPHGSAVPSSRENKISQKVLASPCGLFSALTQLSCQPPLASLQVFLLCFNHGQADRDAWLMPGGAVPNSHSCIYMCIPNALWHVKKAERWKSLGDWVGHKSNWLTDWLTD